MLKIRFGLLVFLVLACCTSLIARSNGSQPALAATTRPVRLPIVIHGGAVQAVSTTRFLDSVGINAGLHAWHAEFETVTKPRLLELGVMHLREGLDTYPDSTANSLVYQRCRELAKLGFRFNMIAGALPTSWNGNTASDPQKVDEAFDWCDGAIETIEGINEPNIQNVADWEPRTRAFQQAIYTVVQTTPRMRDVQVVGPSPVMHIADAEQLGNLSASLDYGNMHPYYGNRNPGTPGWGGVFFGARYGSLAYNEGYAALNSGKKPVFATETGYSTAKDAASGEVLIPERIKAQYVLRTYLLHFKEGVTRTFVYTLVGGNPNKPNDGESHFGLVNDDGTPKPSFTALKNLIALLKDDAGTFEPGALNYSLTGGAPTTKELLLQKRDGRFYLALWQEVPSWEPDKRETIPVPTVNLTLTLPSTIPGVVLHQWQDSGEVVTTPATLRDGTVKIPLGERLILVELQPQQ